MTTRTWIGGGSNSASSPGDWSPTGAPRPGDSLQMNSGTMFIAGNSLAGDILAVSGTVTLNTSQSAVLNLTQVSTPSPPTVHLNIAPGSTVTLHDTVDRGFLSASGGTIKFTGTSSFSAFKTVFVDNLVGSAELNLFGANASGEFMEINGSVGNGLTFDIGGTAADASLQIDHPNTFHGLIALSSSPVALGHVAFMRIQATRASYFNGSLQLFDGSQLVDTIRLTNASNNILQLHQTTAGVVLTSGHYNDTGNAGIVIPIGSPIAAGAPSPNNTVVTPNDSTSAIVDANGNKWTITTGGQVAVNGLIDSTTANVVALAYEGGLVWQENSGQLWWSKSTPSDQWVPTDGTPTSPITQSVTLTSGSLENVLENALDHTNWIFAGTASNPAKLSFIGSDSPGSLAVNAGAYGTVSASQPGVTVERGISIGQGGSLALNLYGPQGNFAGDGNSVDDGTLAVAGRGQTFSLDGSLTLGALAGQLNLTGVHVGGTGTIVQVGENDSTTFSADTSVGSGVHVQVLGGHVDIHDLATFKGTIGPLNTPGSPAMGIFGQVEIFGPAATATSAHMNTTTDLLSLFNAAGQDVGDLQFGGDVSGVRLADVAGFLAVNYGAASSGVPIGNHVVDLPIAHVP